MDIKPVQQTPLNRLFLAINHYISTGDHLGEGIANDLGTHVQVIIPVNQKMQVDRLDFEKFQSRFVELEAELGSKLKFEGEQQYFRMYSFKIDITDMDLLAEKLIEKPGKLGWGSMYELIQKHL